LTLGTVQQIAKLFFVSNSRLRLKTISTNSKRQYMNTSSNVGQYTYWLQNSVLEILKKQLQLEKNLRIMKCFLDLIKPAGNYIMPLMIL